MDVQIPAGGLRLDIDSDGSVAATVDLYGRLDMWPLWLDSALTSLEEARASAESVAQLASADSASRDNEQLGSCLTRECLHAMTCIATSAFALDAFHAALSGIVPGVDLLQATWRMNRTPRHSRISQLIIRASRLNNSVSKEVSSQIKQAFALRDQAVHPPHEFQGPRRYDDRFDLLVEHRIAVYNARNATALLGGVLGILNHAMMHPRSTAGQMESWAEERAPFLGLRIGDYLALTRTR